MPAIDGVSDDEVDLAVGRLTGREGCGLCPILGRVALAVAAAYEQHGCGRD